jgi:hypothetical protein
MLGWIGKVPARTTSGQRRVRGETVASRIGVERVKQVGESAGSAAGSAAPPAVTASGSTAERGPLLGRTGRVLALLFPAEPPRPRRSVGAAAGIVLGYLAAIALGAWVLLERQGGRPAWATVWAEDRWLFLPGARMHPWSSLWQAADGYLSLVPRVIADAVATLPLRDAAPAYAIIGAVIAAACAAFVFRACAGHVRNPALRFLLAAAVLLLPTALKAGLPDNAVNSIWYLLFAAFWALVWRPRSRSAMAVAAVVCFAAATSNVLVALYLPLVVARVIALPRVREHAATIGLFAGGAVQLLVVLFHHRRHQSTSLLDALGFYGHNVILPAVAGHHFGTQLTSGVGIATATTLAAVVVALVVTWVLVRGDARVRVFAATALIFGLALTLTPVLVHGAVASAEVTAESLWAAGSRYAQIPILLIDALVIVAVDAYLRRGGMRFERALHATAVVLLVAVLGTTWVSDFRYNDLRAQQPTWTGVASRIDEICRHQPHGSARIGNGKSLPCSAVNG